jgi:hypothetical protein
VISTRLRSSFAMGSDLPLPGESLIDHILRLSGNAEKQAREEWRRLTGPRPRRAQRKTGARVSTRRKPNIVGSV